MFEISHCTHDRVPAGLNIKGQKLSVFRSYRQPNTMCFCSDYFIMIRFLEFKARKTRENRCLVGKMWLINDRTLEQKRRKWFL